MLVCLSWVSEAARVGVGVEVGGRESVRRVVLV